MFCRKSCLTFKFLLCFIVWSCSFCSKLTSSFWGKPLLFAFKKPTINVPKNANKQTKKRTNKYLHSMGTLPCSCQVLKGYNHTCFYDQLFYALYLPISCIIWESFLCMESFSFLTCSKLHFILTIYDLEEKNVWKKTKIEWKVEKNACSFSKHHPKICCLFPKPPWCVTFQLSPLVWPELWPDPTWSGTGLPSSIAGVGSLGTAAGLAGTGPTTAPTANIDLTALTQAYSGIQQYTGWLVYQ